MSRVETVRSEAEVRRCAPLLRQLRPHLEEEALVAQVRRQMERGYQVACLLDPEVRAVAGFWLGENLAHGRTLFLDDFVTEESVRGQGYGSALFGWVRRLAEEEGCAWLDLASGVARPEAHRFYFARGLSIQAFRFSLPLGGE